MKIIMSEKSFFTSFSFCANVGDSIISLYIGLNLDYLYSLGFIQEVLKGVCITLKAKT